MHYTINTMLSAITANDDEIGGLASYSLSWLSCHYSRALAGSLQGV